MTDLPRKTKRKKTNFNIDNKISLSGIFFIVINLAIFCAGFYFIWSNNLSFSAEGMLSLVWAVIFNFYVRFITARMKKKREEKEGTQ